MYYKSWQSVGLYLSILVYCKGEEVTSILERGKDMRNAERSEREGERGGRIRKEETQGDYREKKRREEKGVRETKEKTEGKGEKQEERAEGRDRQTETKSTHTSPTFNLVAGT